MATQNTSRNIMTLVVALIVLIALGIGLALALTQNKGAVSGSNPTVVTSKPGDVVTFEGTLDDYDNGCIVDATCSAIINGYTVITNPGMTPAGQVIGKVEVNSDNIGAKVKVKALKLDNGNFTVVGSTDYYVLLVK